MFEVHLINSHEGNSTECTRHFCNSTWQ